MDRKIAGIQDLRKIIERQKYLCALTGDKLTPENTTFDHVIPVCKGGTSRPENLQAVTKMANRLKNSMTMEELLSTCLKIISNIKKSSNIKRRL